MKRGIYVMENTGIHPDTVDYNWVTGMKGLKIPHDYEDVYEGLPSLKRGIILKPYLVTGNDATDVASAHYGFLADNNPEWNNRVPLIIDTWTLETPRFDFDHIRVYLNYLYKYTEEELGNSFKVKPLLKVTGGQWDSWYTSNRDESLKLLDHCNLLLAHWDAEKPNEVLYHGPLPWWEFAKNQVVYDASCDFTGINVKPPAEDPPEDPPAEEPGEDDDKVIEIPIISFGKYKVSLKISETV